MTRLDVDGTWLYYEVAGEGPLVILVTGMATVMEWWRPALPELTPYFTVAAHDLRGVGRSGPARDVSIGRQAEDVVAIADALGRERFSVVGASFGGMVVHELLCTRADRIEAAVLLTSGPADMAPEMVEHALSPDNPVTVTHARAGLTESAPIADSLRADTEILFSRRFVDEHPDRVESWRESVVAAHACSPADPQPDYLGASICHDRHRELADVHVPVLAIIGSDDVFIPPTVQMRDAASIPGALTLVVGGGRHGMSVEAPELWARAAALFLRGELRNSYAPALPGAVTA